MGQNILHFIVWKSTKESEHLTQIPKPHLSTSLNVSKSVVKSYKTSQIPHHFAL